MSTSRDEIEFSYKAGLAAIISLLFVYWMYQFIGVLSTFEDNIMKVPYLIRLAIIKINPGDTGVLIELHTKLKMFAYLFFMTFLIKSIMSVKQAFTSSLDDVQNYILILFGIEGVFLYFKFNVEISDIFLILIVPNFAIYALLEK